MNKKELRFISDNLKSVEANSRTVVGYAAKFGTMSKNLGGFKEMIQHGAFTNVLKTDPDVTANIDHDDSRILSRTGSNLQLKEDKTGLWFSFDVPNTTYGTDLLENIRNGNITQCSFAFSVSEEEWRELGVVPLRIIKEVDNLFDVALVTTPAYEDTTVALRSLKNRSVIDQETQFRFAKMDWR